MKDLSHWNCAKDFSGEEAASLIVGLDLNAIGGSLFLAGSPNPNAAATLPVYQRMESEYNDSRGWHKYQFNPQDDQEPYEGPKQASMLTSVRMEWYEKHEVELSTDEGVEWYRHLDDDRYGGFSAQRFSRSEMARWLEATSIKSVYQFDPQRENSLSSSPDRWPWGVHHTELLGHLKAAAMRYWENYDPTDATTAPTNKEVSEWLIEDRRVSKKMAESIASILRPDGLATGPRK